MKKLLLALFVLFPAIHASACGDDQIKVINAGCDYTINSNGHDCLKRAKEVIHQGKSDIEMILYMCTPQGKEGGWQLVGCISDAARESSDSGIKAISNGCETQGFALKSKASRRDKCVEKGLRQLLTRRQSTNRNSVQTAQSTK